MTELLQDWVTAQAATRPHAPAIVGCDEHVTYGQLDARSNQLARLLRVAGCRRGDRVCILMPKSAMAIAAILGTYKADCIFVPIDASSQAVRLTRVIDSCQPSLIVAAGASVDLLRHHLGGVPIGWLGADTHPAVSFVPRFTLRDLRSYSTAPLHYENTRHDPAHILFTSDSTGDPKGVVITHANVVHFVEWACEYFGISTSDRISGHSPLHIDRSTLDMFGTFAAGAELHLVPPELDLMPQKLAHFIRTSELTQWFSAPSTLERLATFDAVEPNDFPTLKRLMWGGEALPTPALLYLMKQLPHVTFTSLYGPTEATIASAYCTLARPPADLNAQLPIGTACGGDNLLLLDDQLQAVPPGAVGDLYVRGAGLSPGYWRDVKKTAAAFVFNPRNDADDRLYRTGDLARIGEDGVVYLVQSTGADMNNRRRRIELGEIDEAALGPIEVLHQ